MPVNNGFQQNMCIMPKAFFAVNFYLIFENKYKNIAGSRINIAGGGDIIVPVQWHTNLH